MARAVGIEFVNGFQCRLELMVVDQQLKRGHQARRLQRRIGYRGFQPDVASLSLAHPMRGTGTDQCGNTCIFRQVSSPGGSLFCMPEAAFEECLQGFTQCLDTFVLTFLTAVGNHPCGQLLGHADRTDQHVQHQEQDHQCGQKEIQ